MEIITKEVLISSLNTNEAEPRSWSWKYPDMIDDDKYQCAADRFNCDEDRYPYSKIEYTEQIRAKLLAKAVKMVESRNWEEIQKFRAITIDEEGMVLSGVRVLEIHKCAGMNTVEVVQIFGMTQSQKIQMMMDDANNFEQYNWTPKLPRLRHCKVLNYQDN